MMFDGGTLPQSPSAAIFSPTGPGDCSFSVDESIVTPRNGFEDCSVDEIVSASRDSFPNVEELVSRLTSSTPSPSSLTPSGPRSPLSGQASSVGYGVGDPGKDCDSLSIDLEKSDKENAKVSNEPAVTKQKSKKIHLPIDEEEKLRKYLDENLRLLDKEVHKDLFHLKRKLDGRRSKRNKGSKLHSLDKTEVDRMKIHQTVEAWKKTRSSSTTVTPESMASPTATTPVKSVSKPEILDRYQLVLSGQCQDDFAGCPFLVRLTGSDSQELRPVKSPFTGRLLKPYIRRDFEAEPLKLKLLREVIRRANRKTKVTGEEVRHPIDYMYVRPNHIPSINQLAREFFWPGVDLSECLQFPDFSCVAVYKKIVVGFAFLVPDVSYVDAYVSFIFTHPEWRRVGIAKFMLYHLIQVRILKILDVSRIWDIMKLDAFTTTKVPFFAWANLAPDIFLHIFLFLFFRPAWAKT